ncbi:hypothetical protein ACFV8Z_25535 [Streptomyces sp. NPDC059837]|uniref:hypothetical protein n=1 Tax=unclassified Streptomyces TaxID=2593676 RepID=UPI0022500C54|nr:hypothetical protein [Streptomyces sp. NBC_01764]MCX4400581.1 hypothetical protein [Streptomyces sp. NBC_01764]
MDEDSAGRPARPAALCPEAVSDQRREDALDGAFAALMRDVLAPWLSPPDRG